MRKSSLPSDAPRCGACPTPWFDRPSAADRALPPPRFTVLTFVSRTSHREDYVCPACGTAWCFVHHYTVG